MGNIKLFLGAIVILLSVIGANTAIEGYLEYRKKKEEVYQIYKATFADAQIIYRQLGMNLGQTYLPLEYSEEEAVNAYTSAQTITVTKGLLDFVKNKDELALILGHELAHYAMKHVHINWKVLFPELNSLNYIILSQLDESNSDKFGAFLALQAGYDVCKGRNIWIRLLKENGDYLDLSSHPSYGYRYMSLSLPWCEGA